MGMAGDGAQEPTAPGHTPQLDEEHPRRREPPRPHETPVRRPHSRGRRTVVPIRLHEARPAPPRRTWRRPQPLREAEQGGEAEAQRLRHKLPKKPEPPGREALAQGLADILQLGEDPPHPRRPALRLRL